VGSGFELANVVGQAILLLLIERFREQARSHSGIGGSQLGVGWLLGRHREQAHSYNWIGGSQLGIGWL